MSLKSTPDTHSKIPLGGESSTDKEDETLNKKEADIPLSSTNQAASSSTSGDSKSATSKSVSSRAKGASSRGGKSKGVGLAGVAFQHNTAEANATTTVHESATRIDLNGSKVGCILKLLRCLVISCMYNDARDA